MTTSMEIANELEEKYTDLNFKNHCYLRIAYDNVINSKWDTFICRPFTKKASAKQINDANLLLCLYLYNKDLLIRHNKISLTYRKK
jgi:hypothetical protein